MHYDGSNENALAYPSWRQGVEPERCASFANSIKHGRPTFTATEASLADGLTVPVVGCNALATASEFNFSLRLR